MVNPHWTFLIDGESSPLEFRSFKVCLCLTLQFLGVSFPQSCEKQSHLHGKWFFTDLREIIFSRRMLHQTAKELLKVRNGSCKSESLFCAMQESLALYNVPQTYKDKEREMQLLRASLFDEFREFLLGRIQISFSGHLFGGFFDWNSMCLEFLMAMSVAFCGAFRIPCYSGEIKNIQPCNMSLLAFEILQIRLPKF